MLRETTHNAWTTKQRMEHFKKQTETTKDGPFYEASFVSCFCIIKWYILCLFVVLHKMIHPLLNGPSFAVPHGTTTCSILCRLVLLCEPIHKVFHTFWCKARQPSMEHFLKHHEKTKDGPLYEANFVWWFCYMTWYILCGLLHTMLRSYFAFWLCFGKYSIQMYVTMYVTFYGATRSSNGCSNI